MRIAIAGGTGFVGGALVDELIARGDKVAVITRTPADAQRRWDGRVEAKLWNGRDPGPWVGAVDGADAVINLAGDSVAGGRWTPERKLVLIRSRVDSTRAVVAAIAAARVKPKVFVSASAVGYYGTSPGVECVESTPQGTDFLAALCGQWEREAAAARPHCRVVHARLAVVLGKGGGALAKMLTPFKLGLGGPLGSGRQPFPWISLADSAGALAFLASSPKADGPVNLCAPGTPTNAEFTKALGRALRRPAFLPAPAFAVKLALGEMSSMLLEGQDAVPARLPELGYAFRHPTLETALAEAA